MNSLDSGVTAIILSYLPTKQKLVMSEVNKVFRSAAALPTAWAALKLTEFISLKDIKPNITPDRQYCRRFASVSHVELYWKGASAECSNRTANTLCALLDGIKANLNSVDWRDYSYYNQHVLPDKIFAKLLRHFPTVRNLSLGATKHIHLLPTLESLEELYAPHAVYDAPIHAPNLKRASVEELEQLAPDSVEKLEWLHLSKGTRGGATVSYKSLPNLRFLKVFQLGTVDAMSLAETPKLAEVQYNNCNTPTSTMIRRWKRRTPSLRTVHFWVIEGELKGRVDLANGMLNVFMDVRGYPFGQVIERLFQSVRNLEGEDVSFSIPRDNPECPILKRILNSKAE